VIKPNSTRVADLGSETTLFAETGSKWVSGSETSPILGLFRSFTEATATALPTVRSLPESTSELSSRLRLVRSFIRVLEVAQLGATVAADLASSDTLGCPL
jgi:hypothetical protein